MKVLVVEDEHKIANALRDGLEQESFAVDVAYTGDDGLSAATYDEHDLLILDVMLPGKSGLDIARKLRADGNHVPILMLTARDQTRDVVNGLDAGADDYLVKPFSFEELLARIRALLRRPQTSVGNILNAADLTLDTVAKSVERAGKPVLLSSKEYALLEYLLRNKGKVLSKQNIIMHVWDFDADILPNNVEVFVAYLRNKIEKPFDGPSIIKTVRGFGYKIEA
ncbi:response regulator transcription factor [soil metagenome]